MGGSLSYPLDYRTKPIAVGTFKYAINVPRGTAEFLYEFEKLQLSKPPQNKFLSSINEGSVWKPLKNKLLRGAFEQSLQKPSKDILLRTFGSIVGKESQTQLLKPFNQEIENVETKMLRPHNTEVWDNPSIMLKSQIDSIGEYVKEQSLHTPQKNINLDNSKSLCHEYSIELTKDSNKSLELNRDFEISKDILKSLSRDSEELCKDLNISLENLEILNINKLKADYQLGVQKDFKITITTDISLTLDTDEQLSKNSKQIPLKCENSFELNTFYNNYLDVNELRQINHINITFLNNIIGHLTWKQNPGKYLDDKQLRILNNPNKTKLVRDEGLFKSFNLDKSYALIRDIQYPMFVNKRTRLLYRYNLGSMFSQCKKYLRKENIQTIYKANNSLLLTRNVLNPLNYDSIKFGTKISLDSIYSQNNSKFVEPNILLPMVKVTNGQALQKVDIQEVHLSTGNEFLNTLDILGMSKDIERKNLKITKRFWVVPPKLGVDEKIIPPDYDYQQCPILGSAGLGYMQLKMPDKNSYTDLEQYQKDCESIINRGYQKLEATFYGVSKIPFDYEAILYDGHPNSQRFNLYIENEDFYRGMYEMPLAINIMIEMVNLVGLIVHHSASQFCHCTGQEAMWFIMELLDDWLNMESTKNSMTLNNSTEHYHRAYRWVRWEAEKVYFNCDTPNGKFMGLKYAMQLLGNLVQYMNQHHYNPSILWPDLSKMDYWRAQTNKSNKPEEDFIQLPDKIKGPRHYNLDTQKMDRHIYESMPK